MGQRHTMHQARVRISRHRYVRCALGHAFRRHALHARRRNRPCGNRHRASAPAPRSAQLLAQGRKARPGTDHRAVCLLLHRRGERARRAWLDHQWVEHLLRHSRRSARIPSRAARYPQGVRMCRRVYGRGPCQPHGRRPGRHHDVYRRGLHSHRIGLKRRFRRAHPHLRAG